LQNSISIVNTKLFGQFFITLKAMTVRWTFAHIGKPLAKIDQVMYIQASVDESLPNFCQWRNVQRVSWRLMYDSSELIESEELTQINYD